MTGSKANSDKRLAIKQDILMPRYLGITNNDTTTCCFGILPVKLILIPINTGY